MQKYLSMIRLSTQVALIYRARLVSDFAGVLIQTLVLYYLWQTVLSQRGGATPY